MLDPRDGTRDRGEDGRERAYEGRERTGDPRNVFLHDVDLPLEREREYVLDCDHVYELNGDDARTLATVGAFRVIPDRDLRDGDAHLSDSLAHLCEQGLIDTVPIGDHDHRARTNQSGGTGEGWLASRSSLTNAGERRGA